MSHQLFVQCHKASEGDACNIIMLQFIMKWFSGVVFEILAKLHRFQCLVQRNIFMLIFPALRRISKCIHRKCQSKSGVPCLNVTNQIFHLRLEDIHLWLTLHHLPTSNQKYDLETLRRTKKTGRENPNVGRHCGNWDGKPKWSLSAAIWLETFRLLIGDH